METPKDKEVPAKGLRGFLLRTELENRFFFRVYDPEDKDKFKDYKIRIDDLEIEIVDEFAALYDIKTDDWDGKLDYNSKVLGNEI